MATDNEKAILAAAEFETENDDLDIELDKWEQSLQSMVEAGFEDLELLQEEREQISNPDNLGETVMNVVWEQFCRNTLSAVAAEEFVEENGGLHLDLSKDAHIQTTENFEKGKIATHNTEIDYTKRYNDYQSNFEKDENGNIVTHTTRSGNEEATLVKGARRPFDEGRPSGSAEKHTDMDHTVSAAEIMRDPAANAHMSKEEQIAFANSDVNLNEMDSSQNRSKGDMSMEEWLDNPNDYGQKPKEIFNISDEEEQALRQKDKEAREEFERKKAEGEKKSEEAGKRSRRAEAGRIGKKALRTAILNLFADFAKEIFSRLVLWFKSAEKKLKDIINHIKEAVKSFIAKLKSKLAASANAAVTTIVSSIIGPVVSTIKKVFNLLKQGWKTMKEAIQCFREDKGRSLGERILEASKIVVSGVSATGAVVLGEVIEKALMTGAPFLAVEIPILGSPASLIGTLVGAIVCGVIGAIVINLINKHISDRQKSDNRNKTIDTQNRIMEGQHELNEVKEKQLNRAQERFVQEGSERHKAVGVQMREIIKQVSDPDPCRKQKASREELDRMLQS